MDECLCSIALTDSLKELTRDSSLLTNQLSNDAASEIYAHVARWSCMSDSDWRSNFVRAFGPNRQFPTESDATPAAMAKGLRDELVKTLSTDVNIANRSVPPRLITAGSRECWVLFETPSSCGIVYSPYGSLEPSHKWGVVEFIDATTAEDRIWATSLEDSARDLVQIHTSAREQGD